MSVNRIAEGYLLYKEGKVHADENKDPNKLRFFVEASKQDKPTKKYYDVIIRDGFITCDCDDWHYRHEDHEGGFICKHGYGGIFKQGEIEGSKLEQLVREAS